MANEPIVFKFKNPEAPNTLYLDRDGVLNDVIIRGTEISSPRKLKEIKITNDLDIFEKPEILNKWNFVIISNQPDIERGLIDEKFLEEVNNRIRLRIQLNAAYICPHHKLDNCSCRKPKTGLIDRFRLDYPHIKGQEYMIGDRESDINCAVNADIPCVIIKKNYNENIWEMANIIIGNLCDMEDMLISA